MIESEPQLSQQELKKIDAEKRPEQAEKLVAFTDKIDLYEFSNKIFEKSNFEDLSFDDFKNFLIRINGLLRDLPKTERGFDGENVKLDGMLESQLVLAHKDKEDVLQYAFESSKSLPREDISYMLPLIINAVHYFGDGNGRTSRVLRTILEKNSSKDDFMKKLEQRVSSDGRDYIDVNPSFVNWEIEQHFLKSKGWTETDYGFTPPNFEKYGTIGGIFEGYRNHPNAKQLSEIERIADSDASLLTTAILETYSEKDLNRVVNSSYRHPVISPELLCKNSSQSQLQNIVNKYFEYKKECTRLLVDIFKNPDDFKNPFAPTITLKEMFIDKVNEEAGKYVK